MRDCYISTLKEYAPVVRRGLRWFVVIGGVEQPISYFMRSKADLAAALLYTEYLKGIRAEQEFKKALKSKFPTTVYKGE